MECAGTPVVIPAGLKSLRIGGRYVEHGCTFPNAMVTYDFSDIVFRYLTITGVHNYDTRHLQAAIDFLDQAQKIYPFEKIVTQTFPLERINEALKMAQSGRAIRVAVIP
jgi:threonine dehydrogenase-like Zn-dependent dehydrogenase